MDAKLEKLGWQIKLLAAQGRARPLFLQELFLCRSGRAHELSCMLADGEGESTPSC